MIFLVITHRTQAYNPSLISDHQDYLSRLKASGVILISGPFVDAQGGGAYAISADSEAAARSVASLDPMVVANAIGITVRQWDLRHINLPSNPAVIK